jgi:hypothetical protein
MSINYMNNASHYFSKVTGEYKFSEVEIVELLEWSAATSWRTKFDLDGYISTLHSKRGLIEAHVGDF